jgi:hypothetical protein
MLALVWSGTYACLGTCCRDIISSQALTVWRKDYLILLNNARISIENILYIIFKIAFIYVVCVNIKQFYS